MAHQFLSLLLESMPRMRRLCLQAPQYFFIRPKLRVYRSQIVQQLADAALDLAQLFTHGVASSPGFIQVLLQRLDACAQFLQLRGAISVVDAVCGVGNDEQ